MKLTTEFIQSQQYTFDEHLNDFDIYYIPHDTTSEILISFNPTNNHLIIQHLQLTKEKPNKDDSIYIPTLLHNNITNSIAEFITLIVDLEINEKIIILTKDLPDKFLNENYPYNEQTFNITWDMIFQILYTYEQYEKFQQFIDYKNKTCIKNKWNITPIKLLEM